MTRLISALGALALVAACGGSDRPTTKNAVEHTPAESVTQTAVEPNGPDLLLPLPQATSAAISGDDIAQRIKTLADDTFEGRAPGTETGEAAARWIAEEMKRIGLQPGGENGSYLQPVGMVELTLDESQSGFSIQNGDEVKDLTLGTDTVIWSKRQTETPMNFSDSEMIFVGYGVVAPEYGLSLIHISEPTRPY